MKLVYLFFLFFAFFVHADAADINASATTKCTLSKEFNIGSAWAGVRVGFDAIQDDRRIYVAYYDKDRNLAVSMIDKCTSAVKVVQLPSVFSGWDAHNYIVVALDGVGNFHVAGNMHNAKLVYARTEVPGDISSLGHLKSMTGLDEDSVTYPQFFKFPGGELGFSYRSGMSGNGSEFVNRYSAGNWIRWVSKPIFSEGIGGHVSAYHSNYVRGNDGYFHVAWVWRRTQDVETNFNVNYAKSRDLRSWVNSDGLSVSLPINPDEAEIVDAVREGNGLLNNVQLGFDKSDRVVISYLKFDTEGYTQLWNARLESGSWVKYQSTKYRFRWDVRGGGTILPLISFGPIALKSGELGQFLRYPGVGDSMVEYPDNDLAAGAPIASPAVPQPIKFRSSKGDGRVAVIREVKGANGYFIAWWAYPENNRDLDRRECSGGKCNNFSDLILYPRDVN